MPGRRKAPSTKPRGDNRQAELDRALALARARIRSRRALTWLLSTFFVPVLGAAAWVALTRFTLLGLPSWPALLFPAAWLLGVPLLLVRQRVSRARCARYLDATLGLDERITTCVELESHDRAGWLSGAAQSMRARLVDDTADLLQERMIHLPGGFRCSFRWKYGAGTSFAVAALLAAILTPTSLDALRSEQSVVREALNAQAQAIADLRADLINRPQIPDNLKDGIAAELEELERKLRAEGADRADVLASIAEAEERVRDLLPNASSAEFDALVRAAQMIQLSATSDADWDPSVSAATTDLGKGAEATRHIKNYFNQFSSAQARAVANTLERASIVASARDGKLAQYLVDGATGLRRNESEQADAALEQASRIFQDAEGRRESAQAVEKTLARLEDGRESVAKAGAVSTKRPQVGFRRGNVDNPVGEGGSRSAEGGQGGDSASRDGGAAGTPGALPSNSGSQSALASTGPAPGTSQGQKGSGSGGTTSPSNGAGGQQTESSVDGQSSNSNGGGNTAGGGGPVQGQIGGAPVRAGADSTGQQGESQGSGIGSNGGQQATANEQQAERVYVPGREEGSQGGTAGQAGPEPPDENAVQGRVGEGPEGEAVGSGKGLGSISTVHTPYKEVLGDYTKQATEALERTYVPPDAKEYVRDYFAELGK